MSAPSSQGRFPNRAMSQKTSADMVGKGIAPTAMVGGKPFQSELKICSVTVDQPAAKTEKTPVKSLNLGTSAKKRPAAVKG